jgi:hypothetical protein
MKIDKRKPKGAVAVEGAPEEMVEAAPAAAAVTPAVAAPNRPQRRRSSPRLAMGAAAEAYGELARTRPMRVAVIGSYLVIWAFIGLVGILVLT